MFHKCCLWHRQRHPMEFVSADVQSQQLYHIQPLINHLSLEGDQFNIVLFEDGVGMHRWTRGECHDVLIIEVHPARRLSFAAKPSVAVTLAACYHATPTDTALCFLLLYGENKPLCQTNQSIIIKTNIHIKYNLYHFIIKKSKLLIQIIKDVC